MAHEVIDRYFELMNAERWDEFADLWTDDAVVLAVGVPPRHGPDEILHHYTKLFRAWKEHVDTPTRVLECGDAVTVEVTFDGVTSYGRSVSFDAVDVIDVVDGKIARLTNWYDLVLVRKMLAGDLDGR